MTTVLAWVSMANSVAIIVIGIRVFWSQPDTKSEKENDYGNRTRG